MFRTGLNKIQVKEKIHCIKLFWIIYAENIIQLNCEEAEYIIQLLPVMLRQTQTLRNFFRQSTYF